MAKQTYETKTVPSRNAVVDDKLKPSAEMHILIGGPYTDVDGEEHKYGHTALRIKTSESDKTYDFGRYGKVSGTFGESGEGILRVWSSFQPYINGEIALHRKTTGFVYAIFNHQAAASNSYFDSLTRAGVELKGKSGSSKKVFKLASDYHALGPNCTTISLDGARQAIKNIDDGSSAFIRPEDVLSFPERMALKASGGPARMFLPANLLTFLSSGKPVKAIRVDTYGKGK